jgi:uncharacterized membrane protein
MSARGPSREPAQSLPLIVRMLASHRIGLAAATGIAIYFVAERFFPFKTSLLITWDAGVSIYLGMAWAVIARADTAMTRARMRSQDQGAFVIFLAVVTAACASVVAIALLIGEVRNATAWLRSWHLALAILALILSWLLIQTLFGFHYARRYYTHSRDPECEPQGLAFPGGQEPDFLDFAYFAFVVGMTSQTSDVAVTGRHMRRLTLIHGFLSFVFNIAILAMAINIIAGVI